MKRPYVKYVVWDVIEGMSGMWEGTERFGEVGGG